MQMTGLGFCRDWRDLRGYVPLGLIQPFQGGFSRRQPLIDHRLHVSILSIMKRLIRYIRNALIGPAKSQPQDGLTAVEYEAICLIAYEGRAAYARARQQAFYCRARGSETGFRFWSLVAAEVDRRAGASARRANQQSK